MQSAELLGQPHENPFGAPDVAESIGILVLDHFIHQLRAASAEAGECIVDVVYGEHDAQIAESVYRRVAVIGDHGRREEARYLEPAMTVRRTHHGDLDAHIAQPGDALCPLSLDRSAALELQPELREELDGGI